VTVDQTLLEDPEMQRKTTVSIAKNAFQINERPTYPGRGWPRSAPKDKQYKIEGLLMNARLVQGVFDDRNPETRSRWKYPDGPWDAERNTHEFIRAMPTWRAHGLLAFTINLQGGSPEGYSAVQPWHHSAFEADGRLRADYLARLESIIDKADELGMVVILGYFYFGQDERIWDERSVIRATEDATDWLIEKKYTNVLVEICNECNVRQYDHAILTQQRVKELIELVQKRSEGKVKSPAGRLLVSVSMGGGALPPNDIVRAGDFVLLHGNGVGEPAGIRRMVQATRKRMGGNEKPILFNEDDHYDFDQPDNNMIAAVSEYAGWGFFDFRKKEEGFSEGYQSVPVDWGISSLRKYGFFKLLAEMTRHQPPYMSRSLREALKAKKAAGAKGEAGPAGAAGPASLQTADLEFTVRTETGGYRIADRAGGVTWCSDARKGGFGRVRMTVDGKAQDLVLGPCDAEKKKTVARSN